MATRPVTPRASGEGFLGTQDQTWGVAHIGELHAGNTLTRANALDILDGKTVEDAVMASYATGEALRAVAERLGDVSIDVTEAINAVNASVKKAEDAQDVSVLAKLDAELARDQVRGWLDQAAAAAVAATDAKDELLSKTAQLRSDTNAAAASVADLRRQLNSVGITTWEERAVAVEVGDWTALDPTDTDNEDDIAEGFNYAATVSLPGVLPSQRPIEVRAERDSEAAVASAGRMAVDTQADEVRVLAANLPAGDISLTFVLLGTKIWPEPKLPANLSFDKTELTLAVGATDTITVTRDGDGAVDAWSDDDSVMTAAISGATVTVTGVAVGNATVRASVDETDTHLDDTTIIAVTVTA